MRSLVIATLLLLAGPGLAAPPKLEVDPDLRTSLSSEARTRVRDVIEINRALLGARATEVCSLEDTACLESLPEREASVTIESMRVDGISTEPAAGRGWPESVEPGNPERLEVTVSFRRNRGTAMRTATLLMFTLETGDEKRDCVFPIEHWEWSGMTLPERFVQAPRGICAQETWTVADLLVHASASNPWAIRFLSEEEAKRWEAGQPDALRWASTWHPAHPYAKYFFLESTRWWRGGDENPSKQHDYAVRLPTVPLDEVQRLSKNGDLFLDFYEAGEHVELTIVTRHGLEAVLRWPRQILHDIAAREATTPELVPVSWDKRAGGNPTPPPDLPAR